MKGLSFSEPMVKAWLAGRKDVTRRLMNPQPGMSHWKPEARLTPKEWRKQVHLGPVHRGYDPEMWCLFNVGDPVNAVPYCGRKPRYTPGETVYIRESCYICGSDADGAPLAEPPVVYRADGARKSDEYPHFRSPRFMPEWAARSHARIVSVRPERVQEIDDLEANFEGFYGDYRKDEEGIKEEIESPRDQFMQTWESLHPGSWDRNDWVWRIELRKEVNHE